MMPPSIFFTRHGGPANRSTRSESRARRSLWRADRPQGTLLRCFAAANVNPDQAILTISASATMPASQTTRAEQQFQECGTQRPDRSLGQTSGRPLTATLGLCMVMEACRIARTARRVMRWRITGFCCCFCHLVRTGSDATDRLIRVASASPPIATILVAPRNGWLLGLKLAAIAHQYAARVSRPALSQQFDSPRVSLGC
jgi:hypothetical protein